MSVPLLIFKRGCVFTINFPPDDPQRQGLIKKFVLCLQEGKIVQNRDRFVGVLLTTCKDTSEPRTYPWSVFISPTESKTKYGVLIDCSQIHTIPRNDILGVEYELDRATMGKVDTALQFGIGTLNIEKLKQRPEEAS